MNHYPEAARLFSAIIGGEFPESVGGFDAEKRDELGNAAVYHGVGPLLAHALSKNCPVNGAMSRLLEIFRPLGHAEAARELFRERELMGVLKVLAEHEVHPLLVKGAPLAYTHYPSPSLRPRGDTDMLIPADDIERTRRVLEGLGYEIPNAISGEWISHQFLAEKCDEVGVEHSLDVHWKLSNQHLFAELFLFDELARHSVPVDALGTNARTLNPVHALAFACTHRVGHIHSPYYVDEVPHYGGDRLIWLYDIHLLITRMSADELATFSAMASEKRVRSVCLDGLRRAADYFGTPLPDSLVDSLADVDEQEPSARYLAPGGVRHLLNEFRCLPGWRARATLLKEHAFPPADYVLRKYEVSSPVWLPALYLHRGLRGVWKLVRRP